MLRAELMAEWMAILILKDSDSVLCLAQMSLKDWKMDWNWANLRRMGWRRADLKVMWIQMVRMREVSMAILILKDSDSVLHLVQMSWTELMTASWKVPMIMKAFGRASDLEISKP